MRSSPCVSPAVSPAVSPPSTPSGSLRGRSRGGRLVRSRTCWAAPLCTELPRVPEEDDRVKSVIARVDQVMRDGICTEKTFHMLSASAKRRQFKFSREQRDYVGIVVRNPTMMRNMIFRRLEKSLREPLRHAGSRRSGDARRRRRAATCRGGTSAAGTGPVSPTRHSAWIAVARYATATCCRECLYRWYRVPPDKRLRTETLMELCKSVVWWVDKHFRSRSIGS